LCSRIFPLSDSINCGENAPRRRYYGAIDRFDQQRKIPFPWQRRHVGFIRMGNAPRPLHIVHTEASLGWGGQEIRILTEAAGMQARGHRVTLLCPPEAKIFAAAQARGVAVTALPIGRKRLRGILALRRWFAANPVDVVNTHSSTDTWLTALASRFMHQPPPLVRTRHISAPVPGNRPTRWLYARATRHVVTTGERLRQQMIAEVGLDPARVTSVPTGIDVSRFMPGDKLVARSQLDLAVDGPLIGIVATLRSWKGHAYLIEAFSRLENRAARLAIVGDGPQRENIAAQLAALGVGDRVILPGNLSDVTPWLQALDVFVLPSYANEGVPQAILQAMLCGLPVVTTSIGSITEAVQHDVTGLIVEPRNTDALLGAVQRLLQQPALRQRLGESARRFALQHFGADRMLDDMEKIFRHVVAQG
jgi:glycosyltransferase involved in cell wall biosynthesis